MVGGNRGVSCPLAVQCVYGWSDKKGEAVDEKEGVEILGGWERVEIA